jgi:hypothetical protein
MVSPYLQILATPLVTSGLKRLLATEINDQPLKKTKCVLSSEVKYWSEDNFSLLYITDSVNLNSAIPAISAYYKHRLPNLQARISNVPARLRQVLDLSGNSTKY